MEEAQSGGRMGGVALGEGGQIEGALAQQGAEEGGAQQCEVAGAAGMAAEFGVFAPSDVATVVIGAFDAPVAADAGEPLARGRCGAPERGGKVAGLAAGGAGLLVGDVVGDREDGGGVRKTELLRGDGGEHQRAVLGAAVIAASSCSQRAISLARAPRICMRARLR